MEALNGSNNDSYSNGSQFDKDHNITGSNRLYRDGYLTVIFYIYLLGLLGNLITVFVITCRKELHTPTFLAICSLAITDFIVVGISMMNRLARETDLFLGIVGFFEIFFFYAAMIKSSADVVFLFFLRYALIVHPLKCTVYLTNSFVISASLVLWGYSFIAISLKYFIEYLSYNYKRIEDIKLDLIPTIIFILIATVLPIIIISVLHCYKMKTLRSSTVSTAITRKMSRVIIIIAVLNLCFGFLFNAIFSGEILFGLMHSCNPFIFFLFHVPYQKIVSIFWSLCKNISH